MKTIWINAGELSGDMQAAALLTALREREPELAAIGMEVQSWPVPGKRTCSAWSRFRSWGIMEVLLPCPAPSTCFPGSKRKWPGCGPMPSCWWTPRNSISGWRRSATASGFRSSTTSSRRKYGRGARDASASSSATSNGCSASCPLSPLFTPNTAYRLIILAIRSSMWRIGPA